MSQIVTTSSRKSKKYNVPAAILAATIIVAVFFCVRFRKDVNSATTIFESPISAASETIETSFETEERQAETVPESVTKIETRTPKSLEEVVVREKSKTPEELGLPIVDLKQKAKDKNIFSTTTEKVISGYANTKKGFPPPPITHLPMCENLTVILNTDIVVYEDDDERSVALKENCAQLKNELKQYLAEGGKAEDFLSWYHDELQTAYSSWKESQQYIVQLMKEGMIQEAEDYMEKANEELTKAGIRNVVIPDNLRKIAEKKLKELEQAQ